MKFACREAEPCETLRLNAGQWGDSSDLWWRKYFSVLLYSSSLSLSSTLPLSTSAKHFSQPIQLGVYTKSASLLLRYTFNGFFLSCSLLLLLFFSGSRNLAVNLSSTLLRSCLRTYSPSLSARPESPIRKTPNRHNSTVGTKSVCW